MKRLILVSLFFCALNARADDPLRMKIGQMIMLGFTGTTTIDDTIRVDLSTRNLGGVILMGANCTSPAQVRQLTTLIRQTAQTAPFIATDEEGGRVARLNQNNGYATTVSNYTLGTVWNSPDSTSAQASRMASWLSDGGLTTDLAPVVDVNVNPSSPAIGRLERSFSAEPITVADHSARFITEFRSRQVMTCLKHFPGHGSAGTDSHLTLPDITATWTPSELIPYRQLIESGLVDLVMIGHLYNATIDSIYPSSLSRNTITGLLRDSLGYQGVVITDAMGMGAITNNYGFDAAAIAAVNAGVDILLYTGNVWNGTSLCRHLIDTLAARVEDGTIPASRIDEAFAHIQQLKARYLPTGIAEHGPIAPTVPGKMSLTSYPNPFNPTTKLRYSVGGVVAPSGASPRGVEGPAVNRVRLVVYDLLGRQVATLVDEVKGPGNYEVRFDASGLASGVYFCRMETAPSGGPGPSSVAIHKLVLVR